MIDGSASIRIPPSVFWDDYYETLHAAYYAMRTAFAESGMAQEELAERMGVDPSLISRRLNGSENLTLKTMSHMGTGMGRRLTLAFCPYDQLGMSNYHYPTAMHSNVGKTGSTSSVTSTVVVLSGTSANINTVTVGATGGGSKELAPA